jgi:hypothetical protein
MAQGNLTHNYEGVLGGVEVVSDGFNKLIKCYNGTGGALANGKVVTVSFLGTTGLTPSIAAVATNAAAVITVGVINNGLLGQTGIAIAGWGFVQVAGLVEAKVAAAATAEAGAEVLNATDEIIDNAAVLDINSLGVIKGANASGPSATTGYRNVMLYGERVAIAAA